MSILEYFCKKWENLPHDTGTYRDALHCEATAGALKMVGDFVGGGQIIFALPIDFPLTDGVFLFVLREDGRLCVVDIGVDTLNDGGFYVQVAYILPRLRFFKAKRGYEVLI